MKNREGNPKDNPTSDVQEEFWGLVERYKIPGHQLSQICNAPIKILIEWSEKEVPKDALKTLKKHLELS